MPGIFAFVEARDGEIRRISQETLTAARGVADQMGTEVHAVVLGGSGVGGKAGELGRFGADSVFVGESDALSRYSAEGFTTVIVNFLKEHGCDVALFPGTAMGKDLAPRVAARLGVGYASDCTAIDASGGQVTATRPRYAGKVSAREELTGKPAVASLRTNVFTPKESPKAGTVETAV